MRIPVLFALTSELAELNSLKVQCSVLLTGERASWRAQPDDLSDLCLVNVLAHREITLFRLVMPNHTLSYRLP